MSEEPTIADHMKEHDHGLLDADDLNRISTQYEAWFRSTVPASLSDQNQTVLASGRVVEASLTHRDLTLHKSVFGIGGREAVASSARGSLSLLVGDTRYRVLTANVPECGPSDPTVEVHLDSE